MPIEARMPRLDEIKAAESELNKACSLGEVISMQLTTVYEDDEDVKNDANGLVHFSAEEAWTLSLLGKHDGVAERAAR